MEDLHSNTQRLSNVVNILRDNYNKDAAYTRIGSKLMVSVNSNFSSSAIAASEKLSKKYAKEFRENTGDSDNALPPHVFDLVSSAYLHMVKERKDQSILLTGESGSGKTEVTRLITRHLCDLTKSGSKKSKVHSAALKFHSIISAFGKAHVASSHTDTASRVGLYHEYQFDRDYNMVGFKVLDYLLEKTRVTKIPEGERGFNVFYYMLAGMDSKEKKEFKLTDPSGFHFLKQHQKSKHTIPSDAEGYAELCEAFKAFGVGRRQQKKIYQLLATILHVGNLVFQENADNGGGAATVKNQDALAFVAESLGVYPTSLELALTYKTKVSNKDIATVALNASDSAAQRDALAETLYSLLFTWIIEAVNMKMCKEEVVVANYISVMDFPGFQAGKTNSFETMLFNYSNEKLHESLLRNIVQLRNEELKAQETNAFTNIAVKGNDAIISTFKNNSASIFSIVDGETQRSKGSSKSIIKKIRDLGALGSDVVSTKSDYDKTRQFTVEHTFGPVTYSTRDFLYLNSEDSIIDFVTVFKGTTDIPGSSDTFIKSLFNSKAVQTTKTENESRILAANTSVAPVRRPSISSRRSGKEKTEKTTPTVLSQFTNSLNELLETLDDTNVWGVVCMRPNPSGYNAALDENKIEQQSRYHQLADIAKADAVKFTTGMSFETFETTFKRAIQGANLPEGDNMKRYGQLMNILGKGGNDYVVGSTHIYITEAVYRELSNMCGDIAALNVGGATRLNKAELESAAASSAFGETDYQSENFSDYGSEFSESEAQNAAVEIVQEPVPAPNTYAMSNLASSALANSAVPAIAEPRKPNAETATIVATPEHETPKVTKVRRRWVRFTWCVTWCFPNCCLSGCGRMKREDIQMAWREKVALCFIIFSICAAMLFLNIGLKLIFCPSEKIFSPADIEFRNSKSPDRPYGYAYGVALRMSDELMNVCARGEPTEKNKIRWAMGQDISAMFSPDKVPQKYCPGIEDVPTNAIDRSANNDIAQVRVSHEPGIGNFGPDPWGRAKTSFKVGDVVLPRGYLEAQKEKKLMYAYGNYYDLTYYKDNSLKFFSPCVDAIIKSGLNFGIDIDVTQKFELCKRRNGSDFSAASINCMNNLYLLGKRDYREDPQCVIPDIILVTTSSIIFAVIGFKFLGALLSKGGKAPEESDKFVICQIPCYTESGHQLSRSLESLGRCRYDNKRKLIFVICDGMIIGSGNDRPTPRYVLDILGVDPMIDPEPLSFLSVGEGLKQHNMGKVYSGLFDVEGAQTPFVVVVKTGTPSERARPGNRGKRDSQMILMRFLQKVHFNMDMSPLELELYHQMKNIIGVNPAFYEFVLMVDADTEIAPSALTHLVAGMIRDSRVMGICGETELANEKDSWVTMIQVYEYFISHHFAKAFESFFGTVTCLPGCFSMYRIRTPVKSTPLLIAQPIVEAYGETNVDTLHKKNLLHLGEDRYLTTLMLKTFERHRTVFTGDALCKTIGPDKYSILLSQRRRWINSTVHNLFELLLLSDLCGFMCFSMRFVVFIDLFSTFVQPAAVLYVIYLGIYYGMSDTNIFPLISIIMIAATYGLQVIFFIIMKKFEHIGWMIIHILAAPFFSFFIPVYSFWHFDDFSWGNTRIVIGEKGKAAKFVPDDGKFDPSIIPLRKFADYESDLLERMTTGSTSTYVQGPTTGGYAGSVHGGDDHRQSYRMSQMNGNYAGNRASTYSMALPPPAVTHAMGFSQSSSGSSAGSLQSPGSPTSSYQQPPFQPSNNKRMSMMSGYSNGYGMGGGNHYHGNHRMSMVSETMSAAGYSAARGDGQPSDGEILLALKSILSTADLMSITKKKVREQLNEYYGMDLTERRDYINACIDGILRGEM